MWQGWSIWMGFVSVSQAGDVVGSRSRMGDGCAGSRPSISGKRHRRPPPPFPCEVVEAERHWSVENYATADLEAFHQFRGPIIPQGVETRRMLAPMVPIPVRQWPFAYQRHREARSALNLPIRPGQRVTVLELRPRTGRAAVDVGQAVREAFGPLLVGSRRAGNLTGLLFLQPQEGDRWLLIFGVDLGSNPDLQAALTTVHEAARVRELGSYIADGE
jgi:hypothetical protein